MPLIEPEGFAAQHACLYLQNTVLSLGADGASMEPPAGLGEGMLGDIAALDLQLLRGFQAAGGFGQWRVSQLFVGTRATVGARSTLHFDHNDNLFLQIAGTKRFRLFAPTDGGNLYAFPCFHALDRRAQVNLPSRDEPEHAAQYPRLTSAHCFEVVLGPGELLFLPAYWWHEVLTEAEPSAPEDALTVSVNFWFEVNVRKPLNLPLPAATRLELARQLEALTAQALGDNMLVADFFRGIARQWRDARRGLSDEAPHADDEEDANLEGWPGLHAERPDGVSATRWQALFEYVSFKACLMVGAPDVLDFLEGLCSPARFDSVRIDA